MTQSSSYGEALNIFKNIFLFDENKVITYSSIFVHAALIVNGKKQSLNLLIDATKSNHSQISNGSKIALNIIKLNGIKIEYEIEEIPIVGKIIGLLSNYVHNASNENIKIDAKDQKLIDMLQATHSMVTKSMKISLNNNKFNTYEDVKYHFLQISISCFLLLPSRCISQTSIDKCFELLTSSSSLYIHKKFAIYALSQINKIPESIDFNQLLTKDLFKPICILAVKQNDYQLIMKILEISNDFNTLFVLKPVIEFLSVETVVNFIRKTVNSVDITTLFDSIDLFTNPNELFEIFNNIRKNKSSILELFDLPSINKLKTALIKFNNDDLEKYVLTPFDDFALLCSNELNNSVSSICWKLLSNNNDEVSSQCLFKFALNQQEKTIQFVESFFGIMQNASEIKTNIAISYISIFLLASNTKEPFLSIKLHLQANPNDATNELFHSLEPSLIALSPKITKIHLNILEEKSLGELDEIIGALKLRKLV